MNIRQAYDKALIAAVKQNVAPSQCHMVACLAVKDAMGDTLDNMIALGDIMIDSSLRHAPQAENAS